MLKVAVTGCAGSGKTSVCNRFKELGVKVISSDVLAREAVAQDSSAYNKIVNYFGKKMLTEDGSLNRRKLRRIIINDNIAREALESFVHPEIIKLMHSQMIKAEKDGNHVVLEKDIATFAESLTTLQEAGFKKIEVELQHDIIKALFNFFDTHDALGYGMSSFGPAAYAIVEGEKRAKELADLTNDFFGERHIRALVCYSNANNTGSEVKY